MMDTTIHDFNISFYTPAIQRLDFQLPHVRILGTNHCRELRCTDFKRSKLSQDVLCHCDYDDKLLASFSHQIQS